MCFVVRGPYRGERPAARGLPITCLDSSGVARNELLLFNCFNYELSRYPSISGRKGNSGLFFSVGHERQILHVGGSDFTSPSSPSKRLNEQSGD